MPEIEFAQKAVVVDGDRVLLVHKSDKDPYNPGMWELPGGRNTGSEEPDDQIRREVLEETGLTVEPGQPIDLWSWDMDSNGSPVKVIAVSRYCYLIDAVGIAPAREKDDYLDGQAWHHKSDLLSLNIIPSQIPTIKHILEK